MSIEQNKEVLRRFYEEVLNNGDLDALDEMAREDLVEHWPLPGQRTGRDGLKDRVDMIRGAFNPHFTVEDLVAEGDRVVARWKNSGTHVAAFMGIPPTNREYTIEGIDIYRFEHGLMAEHWDVVDVFGQLVQLGVITPPGPAAE